MKKSLLHCIALLFACLLSVASLAAEKDFAGDWMISLQDNKRTLVGLLQMERSADGWLAYLEGGPARVDVDGDTITCMPTAGTFAVSFSTASWSVHWLPV